MELYLEVLKINQDPPPRKPGGVRPEFVYSNRDEKRKARDWFRKALKKGSYSLDEAAQCIYDMRDPEHPVKLEPEGIFREEKFFSFTHRKKQRFIGWQAALVASKQAKSRRRLSKDLVREIVGLTLFG